MNTDFEKLTKYFIETNNINDETEYEICEIDAKELLVANRIDLIAKLKYIENREKKLNNDFIIELYKRHLEAFSNGSFVEPGKEEKNSFEKYCEEFDNIIDNIKDNGFNSEISLVPVGDDNTILDGAHRVASCIYFNKKIKVIKFKNITLKCDLNFFKSRLLDEEFLDYLMLEYAKYKNDCIVFCLWPRSFGDKRSVAQKIIEDNFSIMYTKEIDLSYDGLRNFMIQVYKEFEWVGNYKDHFGGVYPQLDSCYKEKSNIKIVIVETKEISKVLEVKKQIRDLYNVGNYSIHSTDNNIETLTMLRTLLNRNSINLLNSGKPDKFCEFYEMFLEYKNKIYDENLDTDEFCIDSSGVLALYGIRNTNDIDFISISNNFEKIKGEKIDNHHAYIKYYGLDISQIVTNPRNYLYFDNMKFVSIELVKRMKKNRNEKKDQEDISLINSFLKMYYKKLYILKLKNTIKRNIRNFKERIIYNFKEFLKNIGMFEMIKNCYYKIFHKN